MNNKFLKLTVLSLTLLNTSTYAYKASDDGSANDNGSTNNVAIGNNSKGLVNFKS